MKKSLLLFAFLISAGACLLSAQELTRYINPFIGTSNNANTYPGPVVPWGMLSLSPFNSYDTLRQTAGASPYYYGNKYISGFTHMNMSGVGCGDMGVFCLMPTSGALSLHQPDNCSEYSQEEASAGYYSVRLDRYHIKAELTTTTRTGLSRYTFPKGQSNILLDLGIGLTNAKGAGIKRISDTQLEGFRAIGDFCGIENKGVVYFAIKLSKRPISSGFWTNGHRGDDAAQEIEGEKIGAYFSFETSGNEQVQVALAVSFVSAAAARENLEKEAPGFDFDGTRRAAVRKWNDQLSRIVVEGGTKDDKVKFYTAIYHALIHPGIFNDVGSEPNRYTIFSLWDTYRNLHPFLSLVYPARQSAMVKSLLSTYTTKGWLPKWELAGMETNCMVGDPAIPMIADTWLRGVRDFDVRLAYEAMRHNAFAPGKINEARPGLEDWLQDGYIPDDADYTLKVYTAADISRQYRNQRKLKVVWGSVSTGMEYCIADWSLAQLAQVLGKQADRRVLLRRSLQYRNNFDGTTGFVRPRLKDGSWLSPFDPASVRLNGFTEGSSWNYSFMIPHDIRGLIPLMGGPEKFMGKLDSCFEGHHFDITNEPDLAYPYLYNHVKGAAWKTQQKVHEIVYKDFNNSPGGLPGNDDCGTMSAWLIYSMMGFYPDCPGNMDYQLAGPVFSKVTIRLDPHYYPGEKFVLEAAAAGRNNYFIRSMQLNGKPYHQFSISHQDITRGGRLRLIQGDKKD